MFGPACYGSFVTIYCSDFRIVEPSLGDPTWYLYKFNGPKLRYEIAIALYFGCVVWAHGSFVCDLFNAIVIC